MVGGAPLPKSTDPAQVPSSQKDKSQPSFSTFKDLRAVSYQKLGCYFLYNQLPAEDRQMITEIFANQAAVFNQMIEAFEKEYTRCLSEESSGGGGQNASPDIVADPDLEYLMEWRRKMHDTYDYSKHLLDNYIENVSVKVKKKLKKKYSKIKGDRGLFEQSILEGETDTEATLKMIEAILRDKEEEMARDGGEQAEDPNWTDGGGA